MSKVSDYAVATSKGWAHPLTGEQLTGRELTVAQLDGKTPVDYYKPNARAKSFIDPEGETTALLQYLMKGKKVQFVALSTKQIKTVAYDFGDEQTETVGTKGKVSHVYAPETEDVTFAVSAVVTYQDDSTETLTASIVFGEGSPEPDPEIP